MNIYLDVDGVILTKEGKLSKLQNCTCNPPDISRGSFPHLNYGTV